MRVSGPELNQGDRVSRDGRGRGALFDEGIRRASLVTLSHMLRLSPLRAHLQFKILRNLVTFTAIISAARLNTSQWSPRQRYLAFSHCTRWKTACRKVRDEQDDQVRAGYANGYSWG
jgi:hypothetical protein